MPKNHEHITYDTIIIGGGVAGLAAAGDVVDTKFKQAITGTGEAVLAVYSAYTYVNENEFICTCSDEGFE